MEVMRYYEKKVLNCRSFLVVYSRFLLGLWGIGVGRRVKELNYSYKFLLFFNFVWILVDSFYCLIIFILIIFVI